MLSNKCFINSVTDTFLAPPFLAPPFLAPPFCDLHFWSYKTKNGGCVPRHVKIFYDNGKTTYLIVGSIFTKSSIKELVFTYTGCYFYIWSSLYLSNTFISASLSSYLNCIKSSLTFLYLWCYLCQR